MKSAAKFVRPARAEQLRLLQRIRRRYEVVTEPLVVGPLRFDFTRVADPDRVLDEIAADVDERDKQQGRRASEPQHLPYWAELWDSAYGLGQFLATQVHDRPLIGTSVLDLGCGMGLSGTVAAYLGARVTFADLESPALLFARLNASPRAAQIKARRLNWQTDRLVETFDYILGADILYERSQWEFLVPFWEAHLKPGGKVLLGEPGRQTGDSFIGWITERGWKLSIYEQKIATRPRPIRLFELRR